MSLLDIFRKKNDEVKRLKILLAELEQENKVFLEEIKILKNLLFGVDWNKK